MARRTKEELRQHEERLATFIKRFRIKKKYGKLVLYKAVRADLGSWYKSGRKGKSAQGGIYKLDAEVVCRHCNSNPNRACAAGLHVSTKSFAMGFEMKEAPTVIKVLVDPEDVVCVPYWWKEGDGVRSKIRVRRLYVNGIVVKDKRKRSRR